MLSKRESRGSSKEARLRFTFLLLYPVAFEAEALPAMGLLTIIRKTRLKEKQIRVLMLFVPRGCSSPRELTSRAVDWITPARRRS